jgi:ankyrin repeat protein
MPCVRAPVLCCRLCFASGRANINHLTKNPDTALSLAVWKNHTETALALLRAGATVTTTDKFGDCPLHDAAKNGNAGLIRAIVEHIPGTRLSDLINLRNGRGWTPLHCAAASGHADVCDALIVIGGDPSIRDNEQKTALTIASNEAVARVLAPSKPPHALHAHGMFASLLIVCSVPSPSPVSAHPQITRRRSSLW